MTSKFGAKVSSVVMGILFILPGIIKTVRFNAKLHKEMLKSFKNLTEVSPLKLIGITPDARTYMQTIGVLELMLGTALFSGTIVAKKVACLGLMMLMLLTAYAQFALRDYAGMVVPCGYFGLLCWVYMSLERNTHKCKDQ